MSRFGWILGAGLQEMQRIFKGMRRYSQANRPYPKDGEMASICGVAALNRVVIPLFERYVAYFGHFDRHFHQIYEYTP